MPSPEQAPVSPEHLGNVLTASAHPDDESMSFGALMDSIDPSRLFVLTATRGEASTKGQDVAQNGGRMAELDEAYDFWGVPKNEPGERPHRFYPGPENPELDVPDSQLHLPENILKLAGFMVRTIEDNEIDTLVTPGWSGMDKHSDHIAMQIAAVLAAHRSRREVRVIGLSTERTGDVTLEVDPARKHKALSGHRSQGFTDELDEILQTHPIYQQLMEVEAYKFTDSPTDLARAEGYLKEPLPQHIP